MVQILSCFLSNLSMLPDTEEIIIKYLLQELSFSYYCVALFPQDSELVRTYAQSFIAKVSAWAMNPITVEWLCDVLITLARYSIPRPLLGMQEGGCRRTALSLRSLKSCLWRPRGWPLTWVPCLLLHTPCVYFIVFIHFNLFLIILDLHKSCKNRTEHSCIALFFF